MNRVYEDLFDTYAAERLHQIGAPDTAPLVALLDSMALDDRDRVKLVDAFCSWHLQWSTDAFALGVHLGLSLWTGRR
jgi:hypothetical protein